MSPTFALQLGNLGREALAVRISAESLGAQAFRRDFPLPGEIPIGSVEFCEEAFGPHRLDFFPTFLLPWFAGPIDLIHGGVVSECFIKDATGWKTDWESRVVLDGTVVPLGRWFMRPVLNFVNEWRYYVANGEVVTTGWYRGEDEDKTAPEIPVDWPEGFSGAVDFGELDTGYMALVEAHAPFACGWYGEKHSDYARWQLEAWKASEWWKRPLDLGPEWD
jgi:hypothetical protein